MANLTETGVYPAGITQLEVTHKAQGGAGGDMNIQATELANRTAYLKNLCVSESVAIDANTTLTDPVELVGDGGYVIAAGVTLTINGPFRAPLKQVFSGAGAVAFGAGAANEVYPQWWGATGDGTTNDTAALQAALTAAGVIGIAVYIPKGTYRVSNLTVPSHVTVRGAGKYATIIKLLDSVQGNCLGIMASTNVTVRDIQLDGNRAGNTTSGPSSDSSWNGICIAGGSDILIDGVYSKSNGYHGVIIYQGSRVRIMNSRFDDNGYRSVHGHASVTDVVVSGCQIGANGKGFAGETGSPYDGIFFFDGITRLKITENCITESTGSNPAIEVGGKKGVGAASSHITITDNTITNPDTAGYGIILSGTELTDVNVTGNIVSRRSRGIMFQITYDPTGSRINISGNTIYRCGPAIYGASAVSEVVITGNVINTANLGAGIDVTGLTDSTIVGNTLTQCGTWTPAAGKDGIVLRGASARNVITGNMFLNPQIGHCAQYGVNELDTSDYNYVIGNIYTNMVVANTHIIGAHSVAGVDGTFTDGAAKTVTVSGGMISGISA